MITLGNLQSEEKCITDNMQKLEPTEKDDIYVKYYDPKERRNWVKYKKKRKRAYLFRFFNPFRKINYLLFKGIH